MRDKKYIQALRGREKIGKRDSGCKAKGRFSINSSVTNQNIVTFV